MAASLGVAGCYGPLDDADMKPVAVSLALLPSVGHPPAPFANQAVRQWSAALAQTSPAAVALAAHLGVALPSGPAAQMHRVRTSLGYAAALADWRIHPDGSRTGLVVLTTHNDVIGAWGEVWLRTDTEGSGREWTVTLAIPVSTGAAAVGDRGVDAGCRLRGR